MEKEKIKEYFINKAEKYECNVKELDLPSEMIRNDKWIVLDTTANETDIERLESELKIKFPIDYRNYIGTCAHAFSCLIGTFDNFLFDDDIDIELIIPIQRYGREIQDIKDFLIENKVLVQCGYIPIGLFNDNGYMCIDTKRENEIRWLPYENCVGFSSYDEFNEESLPIFKHFKEYMDCYFLGTKHEIEDDDEY